MSPAPRNSAIDMFKGIGIALVVVGHAWALPEPVYQMIYSVGMAAFLLLAGAMFKHERAAAAPVDYVRGKLMRLVVPAWGMGLLLALPYIAALALGKFPPDEFVLRLRGTLTGSAINEWNFLSTPLWYLFCLFWLEVIATALASRGARVAGGLMTLAGLLWIAVSQGGATWSDDNPLEWLFALHSVGSAMAFFGAGLWLGGGRSAHAARGGIVDFTRVPMTTARGLVLLAVLVGWTLAVIYSPDVPNLSRNRVGMTPMAVILNLGAALAGAALLWQLVRLLPPSRWLCWLGQHTLPIFGFNYLVNKIVLMGAMRTGVGAARLAHWWWAIALLELALLCALAWLLDRTGPVGDLFNGRLLGRLRREKTRLA